MLREPVRLGVAGRTDAGVHAAGPGGVVLDGARATSTRERLRLSLNALLPPDDRRDRAGAGGGRASTLARRPRAPTAIASGARHAGRCSSATTSGTCAAPWTRQLLAAAAALLPGRRDFAALTPSAHLLPHLRARGDATPEWRLAADGREAHFEITAGSFLHNMVRVAVGSMVDVAQGRMSLAEFAAGLAGGERRELGLTAPASGLALVRVDY